MPPTTSCSYANPRSEKYQLAMYLLDQYRGTSVSGRYSIPTRLVNPGSQNELVRVVERAIFDAVLKHDILQVAIADADSKSPTWVQLGSLDLRQHVTWRFNDSAVNFDSFLNGVIADEVDAKYSELDRRPGWRIVVIRPEQTEFIEIIFTWNHPHCDGMSGKIFHTSLLEALNTATRGNDRQESIHDASAVRLPDSPPKLPPPVEEICKLPLTLSYLLKTTWREWGPTSLTARSTQAKWAPIPSRSSPFKTQVRAFTLEADALGNILLACRQHKTTLTGLLHALTLASLASRLGNEAAPAFASGTKMDMRRHMRQSPPAYPWLQPDRTMGNYVTIMTHEFERDIVRRIRSLLSHRAGASTTSAAVERGEKCAALSTELGDLIWVAAARVRREIQRKLKLGLKNDIVGVMKFVGDWQQEMANAARRPRLHSWWITGIGVLDGTPKGDASGSNSAAYGHVDAWTIRRAQFSLSTETTAAAINISPMTVMGEKLCVAGSWQDCLLDVALGDGVMADLEAWLGQLARPST